MDRLVTSMVFCEAPVDFAYGGTPASTGAKKLAADARIGVDASSRPDKEEAAAAVWGETRDGSAASLARGRPQIECAPAFDGLNCFETVVMPSH